MLPAMAVAPTVVQAAPDEDDVSDLHDVVRVAPNQIKGRENNFLTRSRRFIFIVINLRYQTLV